MTRVTHRLDALDALRALAATSIVLFHVIGINKLSVDGGFQIISHYFGNAVPLFYMLSAFSLYVGYSTKLMDFTSIKNYLIKRFFRIAPLFYMMLFVHILLVYFYWNSSVNWRDVLLDILFVFGLFPQYNQSIVWAGWSVGVEFIFYVLLPLVILYSDSLLKAVGLLFLFLIIGTYTQGYLESINAPLNYSYQNLFTHMPFFTMGIVAFYVFKHLANSIQNKKSDILFHLVFAGSFLIIYIFVTPNKLADFFGSFHYINVSKYVWALIFAIWIVYLTLNPLKLFVNKATVTLGRMSFSLYLLHPLVIFFTKPIHDKIYQLELVGGHNTAYLLSVVTVFLFLVPAAVFTYHFIETPFMSFAKKITAVEKG